MRARLADQGGFGLVEAMVAAMLLVVGALALLGTFDSANKASVSVDRQEVALNQAEKQLEWLRSLPYDDLWMASVPGAGTGDGNPFNRIQGSGAAALFNVGGAGNTLERLVNTNTTVAGERSGSGVATGPVPFTVATGTGQQISGKIYTFVSWRDEECPVIELGELGTSLGGVSSQLNANLSGLLTQLNGLLNQILTLTNDATATLKLNLQNTLIPLVNSIQTQIGQLNSLLEEGLDLCDMPDIGTLNALERLSDPSTALTAALNTLNLNTTATRNAATALSGAVGGLTGLLAGLLNNLNLCPNVLINGVCNAINNLNAQATTFLNNLAGSNGTTNLLEDLQEDLTTVTGFLQSPDTDKNTKRVSVAVTVDSGRSDLAPFKPIWTSSVIVDQEQGLL